MKDSSADPRQKAILIAAWKAFAAYGFRKTSMDDIARGAGMSRPSLYLHYRNKEDIYRTLAQYHYDTAAENVAAALASGGSVPDALGRAFAAQGGETVEAMLASPHGMELLDSGNTVAPDIVAGGEARLRDIYAHWLSEQAQAGRIQLPGRDTEIAATITSALKGIKKAGDGYEAYCSRVAHLAMLVGVGLGCAGNSSKT